MATTKSNADRVFDALNEGSAAVLGAVKAGNERTYRVSKALLDEAEYGRGEAVAFGRKVAQDPSDLLGLSAFVFERTAETQRRALDLARQSFEETVEAGRETRETILSVAKAGREVGEVAIEAVRGFYSRTAGAFQAAFTAGFAAPTPREVSRPTRRTSATQEAA